MTSTWHAWKDVGDIPELNAPSSVLEEQGRAEGRHLRTHSLPRATQGSIYWPGLLQPVCCSWSLGAVPQIRGQDPRVVVVVVVVVFFFFFPQKPAASKPAMVLVMHSASVISSGGRRH